MKSLYLALVLTATLTSAFGQSVREGGGRRGSTSVFIVFSSIGAGIDHKTSVKTEKLIDLADKDGKVVKRSETAWGREGEVTYCVEFNDIFMPHAFIKLLAPAIMADRKKVGYERTAVYSGASCDNIDHATRQNIAAYLR
ncbi:MAG TPA: hypothetical protein VNJ01_10350 [Bacteriovoracaceae bacterium]|nr:hypothetical protein [Bacteriovoracaceae bacterium]